MPQEANTQPGVVEAIIASYQRHGDTVPLDTRTMPDTEAVVAVADDLLQIFFPGYFGPQGLRYDDAADLGEVLASVVETLETQVSQAFQCAPDRGAEPACRQKAADSTARLIEAIPSLRDLLVEDIRAAYDGDPAATSYREVVLAYPCLLAISVYRCAHVLHTDGVPLIPRIMTEYAHSRTGIDIHPGAVVGRHFFIDHGTGVVIGETTEIGDGVKLYQGVTLGARSFPEDEAGRAVKGAKRHPTIEDNVTIYSGATILGDVIIGARSVIGGNVWLTHSIPGGTTVISSVPQGIRLHREIDDYKI